MASSAYIDGGYVVRTDESPRQTMDTERPQIFRLQLYAPQGVAAMTSPYCLRLPASAEQLEMAKLLIGVTNFSQAHIVQTECPIPPLRHCLNQSQPDVELLNFKREIAKWTRSEKTAILRVSHLKEVLEKAKK